MKRIYFLVPDIKTTHIIVDELRSEGIEDRHMHVLAKRDTPMEDMPEAVERRNRYTPCLLSLLFSQIHNLKPEPPPDRFPPRPFHELSGPQSHLLLGLGHRPTCSPIHENF